MTSFVISQSDRAHAHTEAAIYSEGTIWTTDELFSAWIAACEKAGERVSPQRVFSEVLAERDEMFSVDHIHTTPDGRHFRHGDGVEVDGDGNEIVVNDNGTYRTEEYQISDEDRVVIEWDGESRTIRTYTRGTAGALYAGDSLDAASESLGIDRAAMDAALLGLDPIVRDADGNEIDR